MKRNILLLIILFATTKSFSQELSLSSPNQKITINISQTHQLNYDVLVDDKKIISNAIIDMQLTKWWTFLPQINMQIPIESISGDLKIKSTKTKTVNETIIAQIPVSRKNIPNNYNELTITFKNNFAVIFRAYNDGVAYRIATSFKDPITVINNSSIQFHRTYKSLRTGCNQKTR